jgi:DNA replication protein
MNEFKGFPARMMFTPLPNLVFSVLMPQINDIYELKVLLHFFAIVYPKKGNLKFTSQPEMLHHPALLADIKVSPQEVLPKALEALVNKKIILRLDVFQEESRQDVYFLNTEANRLAIEKIQNGELNLPGIVVSKSAPASPAQLPDIFTLYEQNIGILTPLIADELREAEKDYPKSWIQDAIKEATAANKRNWRYIARILERWAAEGKSDGTHRGNIKKDSDPDKYIRGKYGHMVQR